MIRKLLTKDGTETFVNEEIGESYHSFTGAVEEALHKYSKPCDIRNRAIKGKLRILDVCFGMGYNSAVAISEALEANPNCVIEVVGLELDEEIIAKIAEVNPPIKFYPELKGLAKEESVSKDNVNVKLIRGDARETVKGLPEGFFDVCFFDAFSPKAHPHLWTQELFTEVHKRLNDDSIFATYSCARIVRDNLSAAGFQWDDGPRVGRRGPGTIAFKW